jgi:hypothetical protein
MNWGRAAKEDVAAEVGVEALTLTSISSSKLTNRVRGAYISFTVCLIWKAVRAAPAQLDAFAKQVSEETLLAIPMACESKSQCGVIAESSQNPTVRPVAQTCCHSNGLDNRILQQETPNLSSLRPKCCPNERFGNALTTREFSRDVPKVAPGDTNVGSRPTPAWL